MKIIKLLLQEIRYRKTNFFLSVFAVTIAAALFVAGPTLIDGYGSDTRAQVQVLQEKNKAVLSGLADETRKLMRDMGFNLMIVHRDTNMADFWDKDFSTVDMPEDYVQRLADARSITLVTHLVATLQQKIDWKSENRKALLVGYLPETTQAHRARKAPMGYKIDPGAVFLGYELGRGKKEGDVVTVLGKEFKVGRILVEKGSKEDISIAMHLDDAQEILGKEGRVNQILALGCRCAGERLPKVRKQLEEVLPETRITEFRSMALARAEQRDLVDADSKKIEANLAAHRSGVLEKLEDLAAVTTPLVVLACAIWVGLLALANVRDRRGEIGIFRALGVRSIDIASLFLGKACLQGLIGGLVGFAVGYGLARSLGVAVLDITPERFAVAQDVLLWTVLGAPAVSAMASYLPTLLSVVEDPATILQEI